MRREVTRAVFIETTVGVLLTPLVLAMFGGRLDPLSGSERIMAVLAGSIYFFLFFGVGLLLAGVLAGLIVGVVRSKLRYVLAVICPTLFIPTSVVATFFLTPTSVPVIHDGTRYVILAVLAGLCVGLASAVLLYRSEEKIKS